MELSKGSLFTALWYLHVCVCADATCMWREVFKVALEVSTCLWEHLDVYKDRETREKCPKEEQSW